MLLSKISEEFKKLNELIGNIESYKSIHGLYDEKKKSEILLSWNVVMRNLSKKELVLENMKFESKAVQECADDYLIRIKHFFMQYDLVTAAMSLAEEGDVNEEIDKSISQLNFSIRQLKDTILNIEVANDIVSKITKETWEPLPDDKVEKNVNNIIVSSETRSISLNNVSSDVDYLDRFFNSICSLICQDKNEDNNIYLRKVETGSLTVAVSCVIATAPIIKFMFWVIKLCQDTAERSLNIEEKGLENKEKKLKIINDEIDTPKKILEIQPDNKLADELIQGCAIHFLDFLENNPTGTINGEHYDIGIEKLKIEDKEENK